MPDKEFIPSIVIPDNHNMCVVEVFGVLVDFVEFHVGSGVVVDVVEDHHQLAQVVVDFLWWVDGGCE